MARPDSDGPSPCNKIGRVYGFMRGLLLLGAIIVAMGFTLPFPFVGFLTWEWMNLMSPHRLTFGSSASSDFTQYVAVATLLAWAISKERKIPEITTASVLIGCFAVWLFISQQFSLDPSESSRFSERFLKVLAFTLIGFLLIDSKLRIQAAIWILVLSTSYFGVKGGAFTILSGGGSHVFGPRGSILENNNHLGLAIASMIPLVLYLYQTTRNVVIQRVLLVAGGLDLVAVFGTQSRGAFVALVAMVAMLWWRSSRRVTSLATAVVIILPALLFMPDSWTNRMLSIQDYQTDSSFQGRVDAWVINWNVAVAHPFTGAGMRVPYQQEIASRYIGEFREARAAHSIYFEILGGMGFIGLFLFIGILVRSQFALRNLRKHLYTDLEHLGSFQLATALQISITALMVGGLVQSMEMWEGLWLVIVLTSALEQIHRKPQNPKRA